MLIGNYQNYLSAYNNNSSAANRYANNANQANETSGLDALFGNRSAHTSTTNSFYSAEDSASVSSVARDLQERIQNLDVFSIIYPNNDARKSAKSLDEVQSDFFADFADFSNAFSSISDALALDGQSYTIGLNGTGGLSVSGDDAEKAGQLAETLNGKSGSTSVMTARYAVMAARAALVDAGSTLDGFSDAYANDPYAAIQNNIGALKERLLGFRTVSGEDGMQYGFMRDGELDLTSKA